MATATQVQDEEVTRARKVAVTSVRVLPETKEALDRLLVIRGAETFDDLIYDLVREQTEPDLGMNLPPRGGATLNELNARLAQVENALRRIEVDLLVTDPKTGLVFNPVRGAKVERNLKGQTAKRAHLLESRIFPGSEEAGVHVCLPLDDMWSATERDGDVPPAVVEHVKMENEKAEKRTPVLPRGRFFREPPIPTVKKAPEKK